MFPYVATIPVSQLYIPPYAIKSGFDEDRAREAFNQIKSLGLVTETITVRLAQNRFEVVTGWDAVKFTLYADKENSTDTPITVYVYDHSDQDVVKIGIAEYIVSKNPHPLYISESLHELSKIYGIRDKQIAEWLGEGFSRARVHAYKKLSKLSALAYQHFIQNDFSLSVAKCLCYKTQSEQNEIIAHYKSKNFAGINTLIYSAPKSATLPIHTVIKSKQDMLFERDLSENIGAPVSLNRSGVGLSLALDFFSTDELANIEEKLSKSGSLSCRGRVTIDFNLLSDLNSFTDHLLKEEEF